MYNDTIIYGIHPVEELLRFRLSSVDHVYFEQEKKSARQFELMKICRRERLSYNLVPQVRLQQLTGTQRHQGIAAQCSVLPYASIEEVNALIDKKKDPLLLVPASIEDPGNLGAIIRSAAALGADALFLERKHTAPLSAAVAKSSAGMVEHLAVAKPKNLEAILSGYSSRGFHIIGAEMRKGKVPQNVCMTGPTVIILGGEHRGIPPYLARLCTEFVSIAMKDAAQSLNVSATAAILLYEASRQRSAAGPSRDEK